MVSAFDGLAANLAESDKVVGGCPTEVVSLPEELTRADSEKAESKRAVADVCQESQQRMMRLNVVITC